MQVFTRKQTTEELSAAYMAEGIITVGGSRIYTSLADTDEVIEEALAGFDRALSSVEGAKLDADELAGVVK
jgi:hypothetical protein